jgi:glycosyltransferase involved in cell wall biosynthesis
MMLGLARQISARGGPPIVCSLSGEDIFLDKLRPPYEAEAQNLMRDRATDVAAFVALNRYYADAMAEYLDVPRERIHVIPHGLELLGHSDHQPAPNAGPRRIGYLARICPDKGLHLLVEACEALARRSDVPPFELHVAGYLAPGDRRYLRGLTRRAEGGPLRGRFTHHGELTREGKVKFLRSLDIFATPTVYRESKGLPILEAWANGTPAVLPDHGAFPELAAATGGAVLHRPLDANDLAQKLADMLRNPQAAAEMGRRAQHVVRSQFNARRMAEETLALYDRVTSPGSGAQSRRPTADAIIQG